MRTLAPSLVLALVLATAACDDGGGGDTPEPQAPAVVEAPAESAAAGAVSGLTLDVGRAGGQVSLEVVRGGGQVAEGTLTADADGHVSPSWTLGTAPIDNTLRVAPADRPDVATEVTVRATLAEPWLAAPFADVAGWLEEERHDGSTEDLAFTDDGLLMGAPEGLIRVAPDGATERVSLSGEEIPRIWGFAADADGVLWAADIDNGRLVRISTEGEVTEALATDGEQPLEDPNYVMVGPAGRIYLSDPCLGEIVRYDPGTGETAVHTFDLPTEGGPNGMALGPDGAMYVATENTGILCGQPDIPLEEELAGVYRLDLEDFETRTPLAEGIALFGDGLAFDAEGNLYVVIDRQQDLQLSESTVLVFPSGGGDPVPFVTAPEGQVIANVAFGRGAYGETTLYMAMLHLEPFTDPDSRGLTRVEVGVPGQPLLPVE